MRLLTVAAGFGVASALLLGGACTSPQQPSCTYTLSTGTTIDGSASGGSFPVVVTTGSNCSWSAASNAGWIHAQAPTSGKGTGTFTFTVDANPGSARVGTLTIAGAAVTFNQAAATFTLNVTLAQGLNISGPYAGNVTGPNGFSCSLASASVNCAPASFTAGTNVQLLVTITNPSFANADPIHSTTGCDSVTLNTCTVLMNADRAVTIRIGKL